MTAVLDGPLRPAPAPPSPAPRAPTTAHRRPRLRPARCPPAGVQVSPADAGPPTVPVLPEHPDAGVTVVRVLRLAGEALDGRRPFAHLAAHVEPPVLRYWRTAAGTHRPATPTRLSRPHLHHPCDGATEVAAVLEVRGRPRALAARFDLVDGRWRWTAVRLG